MGPGIDDSLPSWQEAALRQAVLGHVTAERRRVFAPALHLGLPGGHVARLTLDADDLALDHALRTDVVEAMVRRLGREHGDDRLRLLVWLTRCGTLEVQDADLRWASAARSAALELAVTLPMVVVTREGWRDPRTGATRTWRRLRPARR